MLLLFFTGLPLFHSSLTDLFGLMHFTIMCFSDYN